MKNDHLHYADVQHAKINTLLNHPLTYLDLAEARRVFEWLRRHYIASKGRTGRPRAHVAAVD